MLKANTISIHNGSGTGSKNFVINRKFTIFNTNGGFGIIFKTVNSYVIRSNKGI